MLEMRERKVRLAANDARQPGVLLERRPGTREQARGDDDLVKHGLDAQACAERFECDREFTRSAAEPAVLGGERQTEHADFGQ